jgi:ERF superfamily
MAPESPTDTAESAARIGSHRRNRLATKVADPYDTLLAAFLAAQGELPDLTRGKTAEVQSKRTGGKYTFNYVDLSAVMKAVLPVLNRNGLAWITMPETDEQGRMVLRYSLRHAEGSIDGCVRLPGAGDDPQGAGSAITYFRRYTLLAVLGLAPEDEDDDGSAAVAAREAAHQRQMEERQGLRPMTAAEVERMASAVTEQGADLAELSREAGVLEGETPTIAQGRAIRELLKRHVAGKAE